MEEIIATRLYSKSPHPSPFFGSTVDFMGGYEFGKAYRLANGPVPPNLPMDGFAGI